MPLGEEEAATRGAELIGHLGVYCIGAGVIVHQTTRDRERTAEAEAERETRRCGKQKIADETLARLETLEKKLTDNTDKIVRLEKEILARKSWFW